MAKSKVINAKEISAVEKAYKNIYDSWAENDILFGVDDITALRQFIDAHKPTTPPPAAAKEDK